MRRVFTVENIDCANCAAKVESAIAALPGVESVSYNFISGKMAVVAPEEVFLTFLERAMEAARRTEPQCVIAECRR